MALVAHGRTQGPESARTTKFALRVHSDNADYPYQDVPVRLSAEFRRPSGETFLRRNETRTNENGKSVVTFGPYHMARVRALAIELPDPGGGSFVIFFDLRRGERKAVRGSTDTCAPAKLDWSRTLVRRAVLTRHEVPPTMVAAH